MRSFNKIKISEDPQVSLIQRGRRKGSRREWDKSSSNPVRRFKSNVRDALSLAQEGMCGYCLLPVGNNEAHRVAQIDHFVPWSRYPEWTFYPLNFVLSCATCNEDRKGSTDTLAETSRYRPLRPYHLQEFIYIHPYLDNVFLHFEGGYSQRNSQPSPIRGISERGKSTILLFQLDSSDMQRLWEDEYLRFKRTQMKLSDQKRYMDIMKEVGN